jgi:prevent-host-death family protein
MPRIVGVSKVRKNLSEVVTQANEHSEPVYLTNFNEPVAVLIGYEAFEELLSRLDDLEDMAAIYAGREEPTRPFEEAWAEMEGDNAPTRLPAAASATS